MASNFTVIFDACVLHPASLRDFLMELALTGLFRARWSNDIHEEWIRSVLERKKDKPSVTRAKLETTRDLMNAHVLDCLVTDYEDLIPSIVLPDENDRHVVAAAIRSHASVIVTYNIKDFPKGAIGKYDIWAQHPDEFVLHLLDLGCGTVCQAAKTHRARLKHPPKSVEEYLASLQRNELVQSVAKLRESAGLL